LDALLEQIAEGDLTNTISHGQHPIAELGLTIAKPLRCQGGVIEELAIARFAQLTVARGVGRLDGTAEALATAETLGCAGAQSFRHGSLGLFGARCGVTAAEDPR